MGEYEDKIIEYAKKWLKQSQHEVDENEKRYLKRLDEGRCWKCERPLEVTGCYYALTIGGQALEYSPEEMLAKGNLKGESFSLSCGHVVETVPRDPNFQLESHRWTMETGDVLVIRQFKKDERTKEEYELELAGKFTVQKYSEYKDLENDEQDSPVDVIAHKIDRSDQIQLQITRWDPDQKFYRGMYGEGFIRHTFDSEGIARDLIRCTDKKLYDPAVCNDLILLIDTYPLEPEKVKEVLSESEEMPRLLRDRSYHEVWLINEETGETARIWPV